MGGAFLGGQAVALPAPDKLTGCWGRVGLALPEWVGRCQAFWRAMEILPEPHASSHLA